MNAEQQEAYREKYQARLDQEAARLESLRARMRETSADARVELQKEVEFLEGKMNEAKTLLEELSDATGDAYAEIGGRIEAAFEAIRDHSHHSG